MKPKALALALALAVPSSSWSAPTASAPLRIGVAAAVRGPVSAQSAASGAVGRVLQSGLPIHMGDKITTGKDGRLQILLLDETVFTIGPDSTLVIDEFVYDPVSGSGKVAASVLKGMFRFVSGKVAKKDPESMKVKLPVGTIGIRGTIVNGRILEGNRAFVMLVQGAISLEGAGPGIQAPPVWVRNPGEGSYWNKDQAAEHPRPVPVAELKILNAGLALGHQAPPMDRGDMRDPRSGNRLAHNGPLNDGPPASGEPMEGDLDAFSGDDVSANGIFNDAARPASFQIAHTKWEDIAAGIANNVLTGKGQYSATINNGFHQFRCGGSACNVASDISMLLKIDFANKTVGGFGSNLTVASNTGLGGTIPGATLNIETTSNTAFPFLNSGGVVMPVPNPPTNFIGGVVLLNSEAGIASHAVGQVIYSDTSGDNVGGGVIVAPYTPL